MRTSLPPTSPPDRPSRTLFSAVKVFDQTESAAAGESTLALPGAGVFAVAEGVGRGVPADVAATASLRAIERHLGHRHERGIVGTREAACLGLRAANGEVWRIATAQSAYPTMAASVGLLVLGGTESAYVGTGGVRLLRWREGRLGLLHGPVGTSRSRLGAQPDLEPGAVALRLVPGDVFVLASEGFERVLPRVADLDRIMGSQDPEGVVQGVVELARAHGCAGRLALVCVTVGGR